MVTQGYLSLGLGTEVFLIAHYRGLGLTSLQNPVNLVKCNQSTVDNPVVVIAFLFDQIVEGNSANSGDLKCPYYLWRLGILVLRLEQRRQGNSSQCMLHLV